MWEKCDSQLSVPLPTGRGTERAACRRRGRVQRRQRISRKDREEGGSEKRGQCACRGAGAERVVCEQKRYVAWG